MSSAVTVAPAAQAGEDHRPVKAPFESWGRYPVYGAKVIPLHWQDDYPAIAQGLHNG